jgi:SAM-dependent methyltransferase
VQLLSRLRRAPAAAKPPSDREVEQYRAQLADLLAGGADRHPSEIFAGVSDGFWLWANTAGRDTDEALAALLPGMPADEVQRRWTGKTGYATQEEGFRIHRILREAHQRVAGPLSEAGPVLEFGCGWGRVVRYFLRDVAPGDLHGSDLNGELIDFCESSNPWVAFNRNGVEPPLPYADGTFGFVYAYSVFSHFPEWLHERWLDELHRVVRPGGVLALTIRPRGFIKHCERARSGVEKDTAPITVQMFPDTQGALAAYDAGEFCFSPYDPAVDPPTWGEACIPEAYVRERWGQRFEVVEVLHSTSRATSGNELLQHVVVLRR